MAFDQATRNRLSKFVSDTRKLLSDEFAQQMRVKYGLDPATGVVTDIDKLPTMAEGDRQTAQMLRDTLKHYLATAPKRDKKTIASTIDRIVREQAFTVLNRLCAVRMAEARELVIESIAQGTKSKGFQLYTRLAGSALGETGEAYVCYLFSLFDELSIDLPVLFDRFSPSGRLFPRESVLLDVLGQINHHELQHLWAEDETIGWIYQYFNSDEERKAMRDLKAGGSAAPRNSRELAVRNQFFTPRYVVEFLTDNTLGRIWYEMTQGQTRLVDECKYLVRRPDEVFLSHMTSKDQEHPSEGTIAMAELLLSGTNETFPEFHARDPQPMIELAHCVSACATLGVSAHEILGNRTFTVRERSVGGPGEVVDAIEAAPYVFAGQLRTLKTQHILEVLFMACRNDRHGGDWSVYSENWFVGACNEVRRRALISRRDDLTQEEMLRQPVFIPYRPMKDPREIKMLDPACGSMHFGLYAFDLFLRINEEAWELEERLGEQAFARPRKMKSLRDSYRTREQYMLDVPRLIIERNIHGIDIDSRAVQIAGLSLWMRAQKAWHEFGIKPIARPQITRSNVACAEPMPGESDLLEQFISDHLSQTSEQQTIASIVRQVFIAMKLAGEAGSLLKIEEEIADTIAEAKRKWVEGPKDFQLPLFEIDAKQKDSGARPLLVAGIDDASFWDEIEERIYDALEAYGRQTGGGWQKRLFANDAARGFAFIEVCRTRYDILLMNPPFGQPAMSTKNLVSNSYVDMWNDMYSMFFVRGGTLLNKGGLLGAITSGTFFNLEKFESLRLYFTSKVSVRFLIELGTGVMDDAAVTAACTILENNTPTDSRRTTFANINRSDSRISALQLLASTSEVDMKSIRHQMLRMNYFSCLPANMFAYWMPKSVVRAFKTLPTLSSMAVVTLGLDTRGNEDKLYRNWWELDRSQIAADEWPVVLVGGNPQHFYRDAYVVVNWRKNAAELSEIASRATGGTFTGRKYYFEPGLTYIFTGQTTFSVQPLQKNSVFAKAAHAIFLKKKEMYMAFLGLLNSETVRLLLKVINPNRFFQTAYVKRLPMVDLSSIANQLSTLAKKSLDLCRHHSQKDECSRLFVADWSALEMLSETPFESAVTRAQEVVDELKKYKVEIDEIVREAYQLTTDEVSFLQEWIGVSTAQSIPGEIGLLQNKQVFAAESFISYAIGCGFGRWDIRYSTVALKEPPLENEYDRPASSPPGHLQYTSNTTIPSDYPMSIQWNGVMVDHATSALDIEKSVRQAFNVIWPEKAEEVESRACEILGVDSLRDYINQPERFFSSHLKRYTKAKRASPIYWPLSSSKGRFTVWVYYSVSNDQTLYTIVNEYIDHPRQGKLKEIQERIKALRSCETRLKEQEAELEYLYNLESEVITFRDDLMRVASFWKPRKDDGVQITAAPLWMFFQLRKWREILKKTWMELEEGKYDWAHLALSVWPDRVVRKAHKDRSIAIAHDLENVLWHEVEGKKISKSGRVTTKIEWHPRELSEKEIDAIVQRVKSGDFLSAGGVNARY
jgi:hypothetical protein